MSFTSHEKQGTHQMSTGSKSSNSKGQRIGTISAVKIFNPNLVRKNNPYLKKRPAQIGIFQEHSARTRISCTVANASVRRPSKIRRETSPGLLALGSLLLSPSPTSRSGWEHPTGISHSGRHVLEGKACKFYNQIALLTTTTSAGTSYYSLCFHVHSNCSCFSLHWTGRVPTAATCTFF